MSAQDDVRSFNKKRYALMAPPLLKALESRRFEAYYCPTAAEAVAKALSLMPPKSSVSWGGSYTLDQTGLTDAVRAGPYKVLDRADAQTPEEKLEVMRRAMFCDVYLTSFNAVSMDGTVFNIDGNGNRVAAIAFGPGPQRSGPAECRSFRFHGHALHEDRRLRGLPVRALYLLRDRSDADV